MIGKAALIRGRFEKKADMDYVKTCIKFLILMYFCIKSDVSTLELLVYS